MRIKAILGEYDLNVSEGLTYVGRIIDDVILTSIFLDLAAKNLRVTYSSAILKKQQIRQSLIARPERGRRIIAVAHPIIAEDVTLVPKLLMMVDDVIVEDHCLLAAIAFNLFSNA